MIRVLLREVDGAAHPAWVYALGSSVEDWNYGRPRRYAYVELRPVQGVTIPIAHRMYGPEQSIFGE